MVLEVLLELVATCHRHLTDLQLTSKRQQQVNAYVGASVKPYTEPSRSNIDKRMFWGATAAVIKAWNNGSDVIDILQSTNSTRVGPIISRYTSIKLAMRDNDDSKVFVGVHFQFASDVGPEIGDAVGKATLEAFDRHWD
jgi:hypothetical protein